MYLIEQEIAQEISLLLLEQIKRIASEKGITQKDIADKTGFKTGNVSRILSGKYIPRLDNFLKLCDAIGVEFTLGGNKDVK